jgi:hypothetical protein
VDEDDEEDEDDDEDDDDDAEDGNHLPPSFALPSCFYLLSVAPI